MAIAKTKIPAKMNVRDFNSILYAKFCSHAFIAYQDNGQAIMLASKTHFVKSLVSSNKTLDTEAPKTLRIPISFVRFSL